MENSPWRGNFICYNLLRISTSHRFQTHVLMVTYVVSRICNPLGHSAVWQES